MGMNINNLTMRTGANNTTVHLTFSTPDEFNTCVSPEGLDWIIAYQPVYMWIVFVLGFIENLFVILIFLLHRNRCTVAEIYLGNMAAADLIFVSGLPFWAISISNKFYWPFGSFLCFTVNSLIQLNLFSSIYFLMMVSIDRYLALVKTMSFGRMRGAGCAKVNCVIIWVFAIVASLPKVVFRRVDFIPSINTTACVILPPTDNWHIATNIIMTIFGFLIPAIVIAFCTAQIIHALRNNTMQQFKEINNEKKATWLVLAVLLVFIICWLPFHIFTFIDTLDLYEVLPLCSLSMFTEIGNQISTYIGYSNSCINPLLYVIVGNHFRRKAKEVYWQLQSKIRPPRKASLPMSYSGVTVRTSISMGQQKIILKQ
ncbi:B2 bradykinin receptor-like [Pseudophryne corroboree]|uniref:B2 bradykinin receptor-like n=1 Tax=Pseudophryne corroboree TaxID=495146 RepID=UPI0030814F7E